MSEDDNRQDFFPALVIVVMVIIEIFVSTVAYFDLTSTKYSPSNDETCKNAGYDQSIETDLYQTNYRLNSNHQMLYNNTVYVHCEKLTMTNGTFKTETGYTPYKTYNKTSDIERILTKGFGRR